MELPAKLKRQGAAIAQREHFVIENDGLMQFANGTLAFTGLTLVVLAPAEIGLLGSFWLFLQWPLNNLQNSFWTRSLYGGLNWLVIMIPGVYLTYHPVLATNRSIIEPVWLFPLYAAIFAVQCFLSIVLAFPRIRPTAAMQSALKKGIAKSRTVINLGFGCAVLYFLARHELRFFAPNIIMLWLIFNTSALRYAPDSAIARILQSSIKYFAIATLGFFACIFPTMYLFAQSRPVLTDACSDLLLLVCAGITLATVISNSSVLCKRRPRALPIGQARD